MPLRLSCVQKQSGAPKWESRTLRPNAQWRARAVLLQGAMGFTLQPTMRNALLGLIVAGALACGEDSAHVGDVHVEWLLVHADGSAADCIAEGSPLIEVALTDAAGTVAASNTEYCVSEQSILTGVQPGVYAVTLRARDIMNATLGAARVDVTVSRGHGARTGVLAIPVP